MTYYML